MRNPFVSRKEKEMNKNLLNLELKEIKEVSDLLFQKMEKKIRILDAMDAAVDKKIVELERLIHRAELLKVPGNERPPVVRQHEISALTKKG